MSIPHTVARGATLAALLAVTAFTDSAGQTAAGNGFLVGQPHGSIAIRGGWALASARSDVFSFTTGQLTLDRGDFSSPDLDIDLAFRIRPRTDLVLSTSITGTRKKSEFRHFTDNDDKPIEQHTAFTRVPVTLSIKQYLGDRGRSIGRLAWIPSRLTPYVGAGGGAMWYEFRQTGDFIDFRTTDVFPSVLQSNGWTLTAHALAGVELTINPRFALVSEGRYGWSHARPGADFPDFDRIDLSGFSTTAGIAVRF